MVKLVEVLDDPLEDSLYLVFEWLELGAVLTVPTDSPLTEQRAWSVFRDALLGLEYCKTSFQQQKKSCVLKIPHITLLFSQCIISASFTAI